jgi:RNA polymerase sigma-70 factor (ECF subfamily)
MPSDRTTDPRDAEPDARLVSRVTEGDEKAFEQLVVRYSRFAGAVAYAVTGDFHAARDVVQESFIKVHSSLGSLQSPEKFRAWLRNVVRTTALDWRRRNKKGVQSLDALDPDEGEPHAPARDETALSQADQGEFRARVREEIDRLPESHREIVSLKYLDGKSYEEIEAITGLSQATIESRLFRARQKLKTRFERILKKQRVDSQP